MTMTSRGPNIGASPRIQLEQSSDSGLTDTPKPAGTTMGKRSGRKPGLLRTNVSLAELRPGECGTIEKLIGIFCGRLRLLEMGLTPGTHVRMIRVAAFGGPIDIEVRGYQLSLRREEAASVWLGEGD